MHAGNVYDYEVVEWRIEEFFLSFHLSVFMHWSELEYKKLKLGVNKQKKLSELDLSVLLSLEEKQTESWSKFKNNHEDNFFNS